MTSAFSWQNSVSLCPASFCTPKPNLPVTPVMATHSSTLAWKISWAEEPGRLQSMGSRRVGHDWATSLSLSCTAEGNGNPLQCSCLENPRDGGAWWAAVYRVAQSQTWLKRLSSSSGNINVEKYLAVTTMLNIQLFPSPGDLPNPGNEPRSPTLQADSLPTEPPGKPI